MPRDSEARISRSYGTQRFCGYAAGSVASKFGFVLASVAGAMMFQKTDTRMRSTPNATSWSSVLSTWAGVP